MSHFFRFNSLLFAFLLASLSFSLHARPFRISVDCAGSAECDAAFAELERRVNADLPDADQSTYLKGMSNASVFSLKAGGVDYANDIDVFIVGLSVGAGVDVGDNSFSDLRSGDIDGNQLRGIGLAPTLMVGVNLGMFNLSKWRYFDPNNIKLMANFFTYDLGGFSDDLEGRTNNIGLHARYRIYPAKDILPARMFRWGGVDVTTGFEYNSLKLQYNQKFDEDYEESGFTAEIDGVVTAGADISTFSIPVTVSTSAQLAYILTLYTGLGVDINFGSADSIARVDADIEGTGSIQGRGRLNLGESDGPSTLLSRGFFGFQINLAMLKLYAQLDRSFNEDLYAVNGGIRLTW